MRIAVIDGKGGGIGRQVVERLRGMKRNDLEIIALGTNSQATANMLKGGADTGATGENAIAWMSQQVDIIIGPVAIIAANTMMGEVSPRMAASVASSRALKLLLPIGKCNIEVVGVEDNSMKFYFDKLEKILQTKLLSN